MNWDWPVALWGLFALPLVILAHWLAGRPRPVTIASLAIWRRLDGMRIEATQVARRLRQDELLCELGLLLALVLAAAGPFLRLGSPPVRYLVLVIDDSVRMTGRLADGRNSWPVAQTLGTELLAGLNPWDRVQLRWLIAPSEARWLRPTEARQLLLAAQPSIVAASAIEPIIAACLALPEQPWVTQLSWDPVVQDHDRLRAIQLPVAADNVGWVDAAIVGAPGERWQLHARIDSSALAPRLVSIRIDRGAPVSWLVPPGESAVTGEALAWSAPAELPAVLELELQAAADGLTHDDRIELRVIRPLAVYLAPGLPPAIEAAFERLVAVLPAAHLATRDQAEVVIAWGGDRPSAPLAAVWLFPGGALRAGIEPGPIRIAANALPSTMVGIDLAAVPLRRWIRLADLTPWQIWAWGPTSEPLIVSQPGCLVIAFDPEAWPEDPSGSFPRFWDRWLRALRPGAGSLRPVQLPVPTRVSGRARREGSSPAAVVQGLAANANPSPALWTGRPWLCGLAAALLFTYATLRGRRARRERVA
jgi:hypothetical protein